jgi:hypothetical protein
MTFEPVPLAMSVLASFVGLALFIYGRRASRVPQMVAGALFMIYPYFTSTWLPMLAVGAVISAGLWWMLWMGW